MGSDDTLTLAADCLLVFIDDTGHEVLSGDHSYYGLVGIGLLKDHYDQVIKPAWLEVRRAINGSSTVPLHGSSLGQQAKAEDFAVLRAFFQRHQFPRFAASVSRSTILPTDLDAMVAVAETVRTQTINVDFAAKLNRSRSSTCPIHRPIRARGLVECQRRIRLLACCNPSHALDWRPERLSRGDVGTRLDGAARFLHGKV